jgi:hypothetical protein
MPRREPAPLTAPPPLTDHPTALELVKCLAAALPFRPYQIRQASTLVRALFSKARRVNSPGPAGESFDCAEPEHRCNDGIPP